MIITVDCSDRYREDASDSMERVKPSPRARYVVCLALVLVTHCLLICHKPPMRYINLRLLTYLLTYLLTVMNLVVHILRLFSLFIFCCCHTHRSPYEDIFASATDFDS